MSNTVGIRLYRFGKIYDFKADGLGLKRGELVIVESELGTCVGKVVSDNIPPEKQEKPEIKPVLRRASVDDLMQQDDNNSLRTEARNFCNERIAARGLNMKLIDTDVTLDRKRIIFYFVADTRIDFRELVKDLAAKFRTRIELRQIGVRDAAQIIGGIGICGREFCCSRFLTSFEPISIKMAKQQELVLNTSKLSGVCGRLMCCLGYECGKESLETDTVIKEDEPPVETPGPDDRIHSEPVSTEQKPVEVSIPEKTDAAPKPETAPATGESDKSKQGDGHFRKKKFRWRKHKKKE